MNKITAFLLVINTLGIVYIKAQDYPLVYENDFEADSSLREFEFSDPAAWKISEGQTKSLELFQPSEYHPPVRSPYNIAVLKAMKLRSFIMDVDLKQTGKEYGHRDMCLFFGMKDPGNFYYVHMASAADEHAHNVFIVNDQPRANIDAQTTNGIDWGNGWNKIRLKRDVENGIIQVYFNDMTTPIMVANDIHFLSGYVGFGSFDDTGMVDNIKIWGQVEPVKSGFFR